MFANQQSMTQAPLMMPSNLRVFSNNTNSYGLVKMSKLCADVCFYRVMVFSNVCVDTDMYTSSGPVPPKRAPANSNSQCAKCNLSAWGARLDPFAKGVTASSSRCDCDLCC
ncbi:hypothetical protein CRENBAI_016618 [Crenichthys baileyi]|uniref:Uncharacterized protein n=1 Tax=Crenichthys baileyi TaxID=28760 RepID=A0AAV9S533_9TELE